MLSRNPAPGKLEGPSWGPRAASTLGSLLVLVVVFAFTIVAVVGEGRGSSEQSHSSATPLTRPAARDRCSDPPGLPRPAPIDRVDPALAPLRARVDRVDLDDRDEEFATLTLSKPVVVITAPAAFAAVAYDARRVVVAQSARLVSGDPSSLLLGFPPGTPLATMSTIQVAAGAVALENGEGNVPAAVALEESEPGGRGPTAGPDVIAVETHSTLDRVSYIYDQELDEDHALVAEPGAFMLEQPDGAPFEARRIVAADDGSVTVEFPVDVDDAVAFVAQPGAVRSRDCMPSTGGRIGGPSARADLVAATDASGETQLDLWFDEVVVTGTSRIFAVDELGRLLPARSHTRPDARVVRGAFPDLDGVGDQVVGVWVEAGAVRSIDAERVRGGSAWVLVGRVDRLPGRSAGPDAIDLVVDEASGQLAVRFDSLVDDDALLDPRGLGVVTSAGDLVEATRVVEVDGDVVIVDVPVDAIETATAVAIARGAVVDDAGDLGGAALIPVRHAGSGR